MFTPVGMTGASAPAKPSTTISMYVLVCKGFIIVLSPVGKVSIGTYTVENHI